MLGEVRVCILGAGIMGCSLALLLARRGARVTLIDAAPAPFTRASRWNEGKIHLGFLYAGDPSLATARKLVPGALRFRPIVEELIGRSIAPVISRADDIYLAHRDSIAPADAMETYIARVDDLVRGHGEGDGYLADLKPSRRLTRAELAAMTDSADIMGGFVVPERSVQTHVLADWFLDAIKAQPEITTHFSCRVTGLTQRDDGWRISATPALDEPFDIVINALWEGRTAIDATAGIPDGETWSYRYRRILFVRTSRPCDLPSAMIATGPFGDIKNYNGRDLYVSWYPAGLAIDTTDVAAQGEPANDPAMQRALIERMLLGLAPYFPGLRGVLDDAQIVVGGGWVVAPGRGTLADATSDLHRRDRFGVRRSGSYISVDTGKYSTAPWLAQRIADEVLG
jgi:glycine/D-amino acid oxidase-like deaminating enzyme